MRWQYHYKKNPCLPVVILTDQETTIPSFWEYGYIRVGTFYEKQFDFLNKVGLIKAQAFRLLGKTLIMDLDTVIAGDLRDLSHLKCDLALVQDHVPTVWDNYLGFRKKNAGVILNNVDLFDEFMAIWNQDNVFDKVTFKDEIIFSLLTKKYEYLELGEVYNCCDPSKFAKIYHFHGKHKNLIKLYDIPNDRLSLL